MYWVLKSQAGRHMDVLGIHITRGETHGCIGYSHYTWRDTWMYWVLALHMGRHLDVLGINITRGETHGCIGY